MEHWKINLLFAFVCNAILLQDVLQMSVECCECLKLACLSFHYCCLCNFGSSRNLSPITRLVLPHTSLVGSLIPVFNCSIWTCINPSSTNMIYGELPLWMVITETNKCFHSTMIEGTKTIAGKVIPDHYITEPNKLLNAARTSAILNPGTFTLNPNCDVSEHKIRNRVPCEAILNLANQAY